MSPSLSSLGAPYGTACTPARMSVSQWRLISWHFPSPPPRLTPFGPSHTLRLVKALQLTSLVVFSVAWTSILDYIVFM
jgi:hypothetical protein